MNNSKNQIKDRKQFETLFETSMDFKFVIFVLLAVGCVSTHSPNPSQRKANLDFPHRFKKA